MKYFRRYCIWFAILTVLTAAAFPFTAAEAATEVEISSRITYDKGISTIRWDVSGSEESSYHVLATLKNHGSSEQARIYIGETSGHSITTSDLVPGEEYEVMIMTLTNILAVADCKVPEAPVFEDGKLTQKSVKISMEDRVYNVSTGKYQRVKSLSGKEIAAGLEDGSLYYGVKYQMAMPQLAKPRTFFVTLVFESPNGFLFVDRATDLTFDRINNGKQTVWWEIAGPTYFMRLKDTVGEIPAGRYNVHLYWDGMFVNTSSFDIGR